MKLSKLIFNIQEIPEGKSQKEVLLDEKELDLDDQLVLKHGNVRIDFLKTDHFLQVDFNVKGLVALVCDRSLEKFDQRVEGAYKIIFEPDTEEETEGEKGAVRQIPPDDLIIDIQKEVRDTIMLSLPVRKIHPDLRDEDGTPEEFEMKQFGVSQDSEDSIDPRWEELKKLKN